MIKEIKTGIREMKAEILKYSKIPDALQNGQYLPIPEAEISKFELRNNIRLPEEYRNFITNIGNGGIGPISGIEPLDVSADNKNLQLPWTNPTNFNELYKYDDAVESEDEYDERVDALFDDENSVESAIYDAKDHGVITIANDGCGANVILVINGENKGELWLDLTNNEDGLVFLTKSFLGWYLNWLKEQIEKATERNSVISERILQCERSTPFFYNVQFLHTFLGEFNEVSNKAPIFAILERFLPVENLPSEVIMVIIDYLVENPKFINHQLGLRFIDKVLRDFQHLEPSILKLLLCKKGQAYVGLADYGSATICFKKALTLEMPRFPKGTMKDDHFRQLSYALLCQNKQKEAEFYLLKSTGNHGFGNAVDLLRELYEKYKHYGLVVHWGESLLTVFNKTENVLFYIKQVYTYLVYASIRIHDKIRWERYLTKLNEVVSSPRDIPNGQIAKIFFEEELFNESIPFLDKYEAFPNSKNYLYWIYNLKGCCYNDSGNHSEGVEFFQKSFEMLRWIVPYCNLIRPYIQLKQFDKAKEILKTFWSLILIFPGTIINLRCIISKKVTFKKQLISSKKHWHLGWTST
jgi:tetratricopeptide (TPR) repeat protein